MSIRIGFGSHLFPEAFGELREPDRAALLERDCLFFCQSDGGLVIADAETREQLGKIELRRELRLLVSRVVGFAVTECSGGGDGKTQASINRPWASTGGAFEILDDSKEKAGSINFDYRDDKGLPELLQLMSASTAWPAVSLTKETDQTTRKLVLAASVAIVVGLMHFGHAATE